MGLGVERDGIEHVGDVDGSGTVFVGGEAEVLVSRGDAASGHLNLGIAFGEVVPCREDVDFELLTCLIA